MSEYELDVDLEFRPIIWYLSLRSHTAEMPRTVSVALFMARWLTAPAFQPLPLFVRLITPAEDETPINEFHSIFVLLLAGSTRGSQNSQRLLELVV